MLQAIITALPWIQVALSVLLVALVLLQRSEAGLGAAFGDSGGSVAYTRRGAEKFMFRSTIVTAILFAGISIMILIV